MKVDDIVKYRGPQLSPRPTDTNDLAFLTAALREAGYTHERLSELFGNPWMSFSELPGYVWRCEQSDSPLARMALLWLLCQDVPRVKVEEVLGAAGVAHLVERDVLKVLGDKLRAQVDLYECQGAFVFTDHNVSIVRFSKHVYEPGADSYSCARTTPRAAVKRTLDLCTGAGLHAILAARHSDTVVGIDVNPRALAFAAVNAAMNGVADKCRFLEGDLFAALPPDATHFDLIVANPPWIATPDADMQLYRWGGETGEVLTRKIVEGLPRHLAPHGRLAMFVVYPVMESSTYLERIAQWLGGGNGWGISLATFTTMTLESFIASHMSGKWEWDDHVREFGRWMDMYRRHGIRCMATGMVYVHRLSAGAWSVERMMPLPLKNMCDSMQGWLDALEDVHGEGWPTKPLRFSREVRHFGVDPRTGVTRVQFESGWGPDECLDAATSQSVLRAVNGERSGDLETLRAMARLRIVD